MQKNNVKLTPLDRPLWTGNYSNWIMDSGKPVSDQADTIFGSNGNEHIVAGGGNDYIDLWNTAGNDFIDAGAGNEAANDVERRLVA